MGSSAADPSPHRDAGDDAGDGGTALALALLARVVRAVLGRRLAVGAGAPRPSSPSASVPASSSEPVRRRRRPPRRRRRRRPPVSAESGSSSASDSSRRPRHPRSRQYRLPRLQPQPRSSARRRIAGRELRRLRQRVRRGSRPRRPSPRPQPSASRPVRPVRSPRGDDLFHSGGSRIGNLVRRGAGGSAAGTTSVRSTVVGASSSSADSSAAATAFFAARLRGARAGRSGSRMRTPRPSGSAWPGPGPRAAPRAGSTATCSIGGASGAVDGGPAGRLAARRRRGRGAAVGCRVVRTGCSEVGWSVSGSLSSISTPSMAHDAHSFVRAPAAWPGSGSLRWSMLVRPVLPRSSNRSRHTREPARRGKISGDWSSRLGTYCARAVLSIPHVAAVPSVARTRRSGQDPGRRASPRRGPAGPARAGSAPISVGAKAGEIREPARSARHPAGPAASVLEQHLQPVLDVVERDHSGTRRTPAARSWSSGSPGPPPRRGRRAPRRPARRPGPDQRDPPAGPGQRVGQCTGR